MVPLNSYYKSPLAHRVAFAGMSLTDYSRCSHIGYTCTRDRSQTCHQVQMALFQPGKCPGDKGPGVRLRGPGLEPGTPLLKVKWRGQIWEWARKPFSTFTEGTYPSFVPSTSPKRDVLPASWIPLHWLTKPCQVDPLPAMPGRAWG